MSSTDPARPWFRSPLLPPALIAVAVVATFAPALSAGFTNWDDDVNFTGNPHYRGLSWANLNWMFSTFLMGHWHPLTWVSLGLDYTVSGMNPAGYHLTSVLIHAANAVLLYVAIRALLRMSGSTSATPWPAFVGALLYALHPLRVESVAWVTERRDVLCGFFTLLTLLAWLKRVEEERAGRPGTRWLLLSVAAFAAALMSKALAILLPAVLLILDVYPLRRFVPGSRRRCLLEKIPYGIVSCADLVVMLFAMRHISAVRSLETYNLFERIAQAAYGLAFYVVKTLWPSGLIPIHRIETPMNPFAAKYLLAMAAVAGLSGLLVALRRRVPGGLAAWLCYVVLLLPVLGIAVTGKQIAADRYTYLSLIPLSVLIAALLERPGVPRGAMAAGAGLILVALSALTWRQCGFWQDSIRLWSRQIEIDPDCDTAHLDRGQARYLRGDAEGAMADCLRSLEVNPKFHKAFNLRGLLRKDQGDAAGARADFDRALELMPDYVVALTNRGDLRRTQGDLQGAMEDAEAAIRRDPAMSQSYVLRAGIQLRLERPREALADYERALALRPDNTLALIGRGQIRYVLGDRAGALVDLERALTLLSPGSRLKGQVEALLQQMRKP